MPAFFFHFFCSADHQISLKQRIRAEISTNEPSVDSSLQIQQGKQPETFDGIQSRCEF